MAVNDKNVSPDIIAKRMVGITQKASAALQKIIDKERKQQQKKVADRTTNLRRR